MSQVGFEATVRQPPGAAVAIIDLTGEINGAAEQGLAGAYADASVDNPATVLLNFSGVRYINSTGIALIVGILARARKERRTIVAYGLSEHYQEIFEITRLSDFMRMFPDEASAVADAAA
jgi:anti-sigma B factor antagonist